MTSVVDGKGHGVSLALSAAVVESLGDAVFSKTLDGVILTQIDHDE